MRQFLALILLYLPIMCFAEEPSVDILGVKIKKGMTESYLKSVLPITDAGCIEFKSIDGERNFACPVSHDTSPGTAGSVLFKNGIVIQASRDWIFPKDATPFEVASMLNKTITRLSASDGAVCTKIESSSGEAYTPEGELIPEVMFSNEIRSGSTLNPAKTTIVFPEKILSISINKFRGEVVVMTESLRQNPVPKHFRIKGKKLNGDKRCGYVN